MKYLNLIFVSLITVHLLSAQNIATDSKGNDVFQSYTADNFKGTITTGQQQAVQGSYCVPFRGYFYHLKSRPRDTTVSTSHCIAINGSLNTSNGMISLGKNNNFQPGFSLATGYQKTIDKFHNLDKLPVTAYTLGIMVYYRMDNFNYYDTINNRQIKKQPGSFGLNFQNSIYKPFRQNWLSFSYSAQIEYSWNIDALSEYQKNSPVFVNSQIISLGDFYGKLGNLHRTYNYRFRFSIPIFLPGDSKSFIHKMNILPYYVWYGMLDTKSTINQIAGLSVNFLGESVQRDKAFRIVQGFGLGIDYVGTDTGWSGPNIFFTGTLNFGEYKADDRIERDE